MFNIVNLNYVKNIYEWLAKDNNVYVGRSNRFVKKAKWGNPYKLEDYDSRQQVLDLYSKYVLQNKHLTESIKELKGKVLGCWCSPDLCHAQVLHQLAGNDPIYSNYVLNSVTQPLNSTMSHDHFTRKSNSDVKPPISPKPTLVKPIKLTMAQLQEKVDNLEIRLSQLIEDSNEKDCRIKKMEDRIQQLEADELKNASYLAVQRRVSSLLSSRVSQLEQYTRRYSVVVSGIDRKVGEDKDSLRAEVDSLLQEAGSTTKISDVDKLHRNGPRKGAPQDIIVRFKTHEAK